MISKKIKILFFTIGFILLIYFLYSLNLEKSYDKIVSLKYKIILFFIPYCFVIFFDTLGWQYVIKKSKKIISFKEIIKIKLASNFINNVTPIGVLAGETLKTKLLTNYNISIVDSLASVYLSRLLLINSQIIYILLSISVSFIFLTNINQKKLINGIAIILLICLIVLITIYYIAFKKGIINVFFKIIKIMRLNFKFIKKQKEKLKLFDQKITFFYKNNKKNFFKSLGSFLIAWFIGVIELYIGMIFLDSKISFNTAIAIDSINSMLKALIFFLPAGLGIMEAGYIGLFIIFPGISDPYNTAITFSILRRLRELTFLFLGMLQFLFLKKKLPNKISNNKNF